MKTTRFGKTRFVNRIFNIPYEITISVKVTTLDN